jgi:hypothetical protein
MTPDPACAMQLGGSHTGKFTTPDALPNSVAPTHLSVHANRGSLSHPKE